MSATGGERVSESEVLRVLAPGGVALSLNPKSQIQNPKSVKPWPKELDEWTHFLHDATGNAVAHDGVVAAPRRLQWAGGPLWARSHEYDSSLCAMVSARGRLFYIFDEGPTGIVDKRIPDKWTLTARDAFNGVVLWKREIADWGWKAWKLAELEDADWSRMGSHRTRLPLAIPRRLVADGDRVYVTLGYQAPLSALDAATGQTVMTFGGTERTDEIVCQDGLLILSIRTSLSPGNAKAGKKGAGRQEASPAILVALEADTGRRLWQSESRDVIPLSLALRRPHVFYHDRDGVVCLDAATGAERWRTATDAAQNSIWNTATTLLVSQDVALCASAKRVLALSVADGKTLWELPGAKGFGAVNPPDLFVADGLVWYGRGSIESPSITGFNLRTGAPERTVDLGGVITRGHHARCYRSKATDNYLLSPKRGVEFIDLKGRGHSRHNWVRGACRYGLLPCNGLLYSTPHPCFCYAGVKLGGFMALAPEGQKSEVRSQRAETDRVERGPAFGEISDFRSQISEADEWAMYRHDAKRSGSTRAEVALDVRPLWQAELGG
ncbi:MAG: hypothetical protein FJ278_18590, partial [Planctomycetes bacterium]|nr:hypothetical protein [Planctomycetota bacterium]